MRILALDLGKNKSVYVDYAANEGERAYGKIGTNAHELRRLLERYTPDRDQEFDSRDL